MSTWTLGAAAFLYLITALDLYKKSQSWMAAAFVAYAVANVCFIGATR